MASTTFALDVRHPIKLVAELMTYLGVGAQLSLEGDLSKLDVSVKVFGSSKESSILRRNTNLPRQDFIILPLDDECAQLIKTRVLQSVGLNSRVVHVQIEQGGNLVFVHTTTLAGSVSGFPR